MSDEKKPEGMNNDEKIAAGLLSRYTRSCSGCGTAMKFNTLPGPSKCESCAPPAEVRP